jgi:hypothetical protein
MNKVCRDQQGSFFCIDSSGILCRRYKDKHELIVALYNHKDIFSIWAGKVPDEYEILFTYSDTNTLKERYPESFI